MGEEYSKMYRRKLILESMLCLEKLINPSIQELESINIF